MKDIELALRRLKQNGRIAHTPRLRGEPRSQRESALLELARERDNLARTDLLTGLGNALALSDMAWCAPFPDAIELRLLGRSSTELASDSAIRAIGAVLIAYHLDAYHLGLGRFAILFDSREQLEQTLDSLHAVPCSKIVLRVHELR